jgi:hypothetical protein
MKRLKELSGARGELGATSAYFYALAIYNSGAYFKWRQNDNQDGVDDELIKILTSAVKKTRNDELAARANFIMAAINKNRAGGRYDWQTKTTNYECPELFMPYYRALSGLKEARFVRDISFNCPAAASFLK